MNKTEDFPIKVGLSVWFCICILIAIWVFTKFSNGRQQFYSNLHVVEESLRKMQEKLELEQRKKSMGYVENLEDITKCLENLDGMENLTRPEDDDGKILSGKEEAIVEGEEAENKKDL